MKHKSAEQLRAFEQKVADEFAKGTLPFLIHLSGGNEDWLVKFFDERVCPGDWILSTHRNHFHYLLAGGSEEDLMEKIKAGDSMFVFDHKLNFLSSSVLGGLCSAAAGLAWAVKPRSTEDVQTVGAPPHVWCFLGDGAEDNGHLYEAVLWSWGKSLPVTFIIEDNDRSVDVPISERTGGFRMEWPENVVRHHYVPTWPHAGAGLKTMVAFDPAIVASHLEQEAER